MKNIVMAVSYRYINLGNCKFFFDLYSCNLFLKDKRFYTWSFKADKPVIITRL